MPHRGQRTSFRGGIQGKFNLSLATKNDLNPFQSWSVALGLPPPASRQQRCSGPIMSSPPSPTPNSSKVDSSPQLPIMYRTDVMNPSVASCHLISLVPRALSKRASSQELVQGFLSHMYDHGFLLRTFVMAAWVLSWVPRTEAFAEEWRLMCPKLPMLDLFDADDPEGE